MYPNNGRKSLKLDSTKDLKKGDTNFEISGNVLEMVNQLWALLKDEILKLDKRKGKLMTIPQRITRGFVDSLHVPREKEKERFVTWGIIQVIQRCGFIERN